jgi:hypothetical protein
MQRSSLDTGIPTPCSRRVNRSVLTASAFLAPRLLSITVLCLCAWQTFYGRPSLLFHKIPLFFGSQGLHRILQIIELQQ